MKNSHLFITVGFGFLIYLLFEDNTSEAATLTQSSDSNKTLLQLNNPGGMLANSIKYKGELAPVNNFKNFDTIANGYRAIFANLAAYLDLGWDTLYEIPKHYAPAGSGNNSPEDYSKFLINTTGIDGNAKLSFDNAQDITAVVKAIANLETGFIPNANDVADGYKNFITDFPKKAPKSSLYVVQETE